MEKVFSNFKVEKNPSEENLIKYLKEDKNVVELCQKNKCSLDIVDKFPYQFNSWLNTKTICKECKGIEQCPFNKGQFLDLIIENGYVSNAYRKCDYLKNYQKDIRHKDNYLVCQLSDNQLRYSFDTTDLKYESDSYMSIFALVRQYLTQPIKKGLYFYGPIGTGKTYLACCLTNEFARKGNKVAFIHVPTFTSDIKFNLLDNSYVNNQMYLLKKADVLVLDDIGAENQTAFIRDEILLPLLDYRMENNKLTFFTSNCSLEELKKRLAYVNNTIDDVKAERIIERIKVLSELINLQGKSRRNI